MRSILFILLHRPRTVEDCLHAPFTPRLRTADLSLKTPEIVSELYIARKLVARFSFVYDSKHISVEEICGGFFIYKTPVYQKQKIDSANRRLKFLIAKIEDYKIQITGKDLTFSYSLIFDRRAI